MNPLMPSVAAAASMFPLSPLDVRLAGTQPGDPPCPDIGTRLARFLVLRAIGRSFDELARAFNLSYEQVRLLLARHGEPPRLAGAQAAAMGRALAAQTTTAPATHATRTHDALQNDGWETVVDLETGKSFRVPSHEMRPTTEPESA
jgi:hypothetical protein